MSIRSRVLPADDHAGTLAQAGRRFVSPTVALKD
jgi:hypothetical protein